MEDKHGEAWSEGGRCFSFPVDRWKDQGTGRLAGGDAGPRPGPHSQVDPEVVEEWKWRGVPVWSHAGIICTGETYKNAVKLTFAKGASLEDPSALFNASLEGNLRRAVDFHEGDEVDEEALGALVRAAMKLNMSTRASVRAGRKPGSA